REEDVAELGRAVDASGAEAAAPRLEVVEVEQAAPVGVAGCGPDASARGGEPLEQQVREQERGEVVEREGPLEAVGRQVARGEHGASVVREHVDARVVLEQLGGGPAYLVHPSQVCPPPGRPHARGGAADAAQLGAAPSQLDGGRLADPASGTSEDHDWHRWKAN